MKGAKQMKEVEELKEASNSFFRKEFATLKAAPLVNAIRCAFMAGALYENKKMKMNGVDHE